MHDIDGDITVAFIGGIGHNCPTVFRSLFSGVVHGIIVITLNADDFGAIERNRGAAAFADSGVDVNHAMATEQLCAPSDGATMIAIRCTGDRHLRYDVRILAR